MIKNYESGVSEKEIVSIFMTSIDTMNRWIRQYKEIEIMEPCKRTKYRAGRFSDEALREHVLTKSSAGLEERALFFSVKRQSVFARMKSLGATRKKRRFSMKRDEEKKEFCKITEGEKGSDIIYNPSCHLKYCFFNATC